MLDVADIRVKAGDGGDGAIGFRREKYVPRGGPDGGDGGRGGHVFLVADPGMNTLLAFRYRKALEAGGAGYGRGKNMHGKNGRDLEVRVPVGTVVWRKGNGDKREPVADLVQPGQVVLLARGGDGGRGNARFATSTNQAPRLAEKGEKGEGGAFVLELKLLADVGIIGYPNVGKSSLLAAASAARPKIADYPFTTLEPNLGVVALGWRTMVLADIPGLIEGAHRGKGLGHDFLRHVERTRLLVHLVDGTSPHPARDVRQVNRELALFNDELGRKPQMVAVNKIDLPEVRTRIPRLRAWLVRRQPLLFISAATGEGVGDLMKAAAQYLEGLPKGPPTVGPVPGRVSARPRPRPEPEVTRGDGIFVVRYPPAERLAARVDVRDPVVRGQLWEQFYRMGVVRALERAGATPGATLRLGDVEMEWR